MSNDNSIKPSSAVPQFAAATPLAAKAAAPSIYGPGPRAALAQLGRVADMAGLSQVLSRELSAARRVGTRPALMLIEVAVRAPQSLQQLHDEQTQARMQGLTERVVEIMGGRLRSRVRAADVALRVGKQGLAVVLQNVERANVAAIQTRLNKALSGHYELETLSLHAVLSMGSAKCESPRMTAAEMCEAAEAALKAHGVAARWPQVDSRRSLELRMPATGTLTGPLNLSSLAPRGISAS